MADETERLSFLAKIASQFYDEGLSEAEIAAASGLPMAEVNALLAEAQEKGIVEVFVHYPWKTSPDLERKLKDTFHLKDVRVLVRENKNYDEVLQGLGTLAANYLNSIIQEKDIIGISWGSALRQMVRALPPAACRRLKLSSSSAPRDPKRCWMMARSWPGGWRTGSVLPAAT